MTTTTPTTAPTDLDLLAAALRANMWFSAGSGATAALGATWLDGVLGVPWPLLVGLGIGLVGFAALLARILADLPRRRGHALAVAAADAAWVIGAVPVVALDLMTGVGDVVLVAVTLVVAGITVAQVRGLRRD